MKIRDNKGMGYIQVIIIIVFVAMVVAGGIYYIRMRLNKEYNETIKTNMLLIEWKVKDYKDKKTASKEEFVGVGSKLSEMQGDSVISEWLSKGIIENSQYDKYYVLKDEDLANLSLEISNEEGAYYIVNYDTMDIIFSKGCRYDKDKILYRLSDIENEN